MFLTIHGCQRFNRVVLGMGKRIRRRDSPLDLRPEHKGWHDCGQVGDYAELK